MLHVSELGGPLLVLRKFCCFARLFTYIYTQFVIMAAGGRPGGWFLLLNFGGVTKAPTIRHTYIINLLVDDDDVILANAKKSRAKNNN